MNKAKILAALGTAFLMLIAMVIVVTVLTANWQTLSNAGIMSYLNEKGVVHINQHELEYVNFDNVLETKELDALSKLSNQYYINIKQDEKISN